MKKGKSTQAIHGREDSQFLSATYPIYQTSTFGVAQSDDYARFFVEGDPEAYVYTRVNNPTVRNVEERMAALENGEDAIVFSSGMAAVTAAVLSVVRGGDTLVCSRPLYGGTHHFLEGVLPTLGIDVQFLDAEQLYDLARYAPGAKAVYIETPANPTLAVVDIRRVVATANRVGAATIIDNTFASPINQNPLDLGVDIVLHSATKYIGGHSDLIAGVVISSKARIAAVREMLIVFGGCISPFNAFLMDRSLKTLPVRMRVHNENAMRAAEFFAADRRIKDVHYPGLPTSPDYAVARSQMRGFSGMLAVELTDGDSARTFVDALELSLNAVSLGSVESLVTIPALSTHAGVSEEERLIARVTPATVRLSVGLEDVEDLIADFEQALSRIPALYPVS